MRYLNIIGTMLVVVAVSIAGYGSYQSHDFTMTTESHISYNEEIIQLDNVKKSVKETDRAVIKSDTQVTVEVNFIDEMAKAVMGESGSEPLVGKVAVAATILNRMEYYNQTVYQALEAYDAYPYYGVVTEECYRAVEIAIENRDLFPRDMMYFRTMHYHNFGVPYVQIGNHYFSCKGE